MCMIDLADPCDHYESETRTARVQHKCIECGRLISAGEKYLHSRFLQEGLWSTSKACSHCTWAAQWLVRECRGYLVGGVSEDLCDHWYESNYRSVDLARRIVGIRRRWTRKDGQLMVIPWKRGHAA